MLICAATIALRKIFSCLVVITCPLLIRAVTGAAVSCAVSAAAVAGDLSGEWYFDVLTSPNGPGQREVVILQEGERIIGFIDSDSASGRFVGSVAGDELEFTAVLAFGGQPLAAVYSAKIEGDTLSGTIEYGLYGTATFVGFRGRRPSEEPVKESTSGDSIVDSARDAGIDARRVDDSFGVTHADHLVPEMLEVSGGRFQMGSNDPAVNPDFGEDFAHVHAVEVSDFRIGRFLVTNAQYLEFCAATNRPPPLAPRGWGNYLHSHPNHPVVNVSYDDASDYAGWLSELTGNSFRLPTEAQWEYAARAGTDGANYVFGESWEVEGANTSTWHIGAVVDRDAWKRWWDTQGEAQSKSQPMTTRVGRFPPNAWGLYDMVGNVWEWMHDWYQSDYYTVSPVKDPGGPPAGDERSLRGCSWYNKPDVCFIATRDRYEPDQRLYYAGFRVVAGGGASP